MVSGKIVSHAAKGRLDVRHFFVRSFEVIISAFIVVSLIGVGLAGLIAFLSEGGPSSQTAYLPALTIWAVGLVYILFIGGLLYLVLGIYQNTQRTVELLEKLSETGLKK
jgi:hypothetical protein